MLAIAMLTALAGCARMAGRFPLAPPQDELKVCTMKGDLHRYFRQNSYKQRDACDLYVKLSGVDLMIVAFGWVKAVSAHSDELLFKSKAMGFFRPTDKLIARVEKAFRPGTPLYKKVARQRTGAPSAEFESMKEFLQKP